MESVAGRRHGDRPDGGQRLEGGAVPAWPVFLEDGTHFLYFRSGSPETAGIYAGSLDTKPADQSQTRILANPLTANYANGYLFFMREMTMMAQPFDRRRLQLTGTAVAIADAIRTTWFGTEVFSVSSGGALAYATAPAVESSQLTWVDRQGKVISHRRTTKRGRRGHPVPGWKARGGS